MKRKLLSLALALVLALCIVPTAKAADDPVDLAKKKILNGYATGATTVVLSDCHISRDQLTALYDELLKGNELPWYADGYQYTYNETTNIVREFTPKVLSAEEYDRGLYEQRIAEILQQTVLPGMTHLEIALSVHDYLAVNAQYDDTKTYYEGYDLLVRGTAVCNGYAEAYMDLLKRAGVECHYVLSDTMNHGWNQVKIGDEWYHVDVTWDDATPHRQGNVDHTYFMLSDEAIGSLEKPHYAYEALHKSTDTTYDGADFWDDTISAVCYESADVFYYHKLVEKTNYIYCNQGGEEKVLYEYDNGIKDGDTTYRYKTRGLNLVDGRLYFCSGSTVFSIKTDGSDLREEHKEAANASYGIIGSQLSGNTLYLTTWNLKGTYYSKTVKLENIAVHTHTYNAQRVEGQCNQRGGNVFTCDCGVTYKVEDTAAPGHNYVQKDHKARGLLEHGWRSWVCSRCGDGYTETLYAVFSVEFLTNWDNLRWILTGISVLVILVGCFIRKKK